jgi:hypothetical protein
VFTIQVVLTHRVCRSRHAPKNSALLINLIALVSQNRTHQAMPSRTVRTRLSHVIPFQAFRRSTAECAGFSPLAWQTTLFA